MTIDELSEYGMHRMDDDEVEGFLASHSLGVLGLSTEGAPFLIPMSYGFDGGSRLYFFFVVGRESRKAELASEAESASFLVYSAETLFNWSSVLLTGTLRRLPEEKRSDLSEAHAPGWRPELFEAASETEETQLYEFRIREWTGIRHTGLPPGFNPRPGGDQSE